MKDHERGKQGTVTKRETRDVLSVCVRVLYLDAWLPIYNESFHRKNVIMVKWGK